MKRTLFVLCIINFLIAAGYAQTRDDDPVGCLNVEYPSLNPFPSAIFMPACTGQPESITSDAHLMEYSMVHVTEGTEYTFSLSVAIFYVTISDSEGIEVLAGGEGSVTWTPDFSGQVRFYSHFNADCGLDKDTEFKHARRVQCGIGEEGEKPSTCDLYSVPSNNLEGNYTLAKPVAFDIPVGNEAITIYGIEPTLTGEGTSFEFTIYGNNNGFPVVSNVIGTRTGSLLGTELVGTQGGVDYKKYSIVFDSPLELEANTTYWISLVSDASGWEITSDAEFKLGSADVYNYGGTTWMQLWPNKEFVFNLLCEEGEETVPMTEVISFTWRGNAYVAKNFSIAATEGKAFSIDWGGGQMTTHIGEGTDGQVVVQPSSYGDAENYTVVISVTDDCEITGLAIFNKQISALDVSACESLEGLSCYRNQLSELDLTNNAKLTALYCHENNLAELDVTNCIVLSDFNCSFNQLESLDVSKCTALTGLYCNGNSLDELKVDSNTALIDLICDMNELTILDVSNCTELAFLSFGYNSISNPDVSKNTVLKQLFCDDNGISTLDITNNTMLTHLYCTLNDLNDLDLSKNTDLTVMHIYGNKLNRIDISNNPSLTTLHYFNNRLPLSDLYIGSKLMETEGNIVIPGIQTHLEQSAETYSAVNLAGEMILGGFETDIVVKKEEIDAVEGVDYSLDYTTEILTFLAEGNYVVTLTNDEAIAYSYQRAQVIMPFRVGGAAIADVAAIDLHVYPNPTTGLLRIGNHDLQIISVSVFDAFGRIVEGKSRHNSLQDGILIDISDLLAGIYFIKIETDKGMQTKKVFKL